ncbi:formyltetrahydrofolate deformylase [Comamonadaceae bacterium G21597-S1]|nr:formyltetrahydrofolate deformylase [Comamonadaceae bacterium G21597-S1]
MRLILTLSCPDRPGIVHAVSGFLLAQGGNIVEAAQFDDAVTGVFFMRVCFELKQGDARAVAEIQEAFVPLATEFSMKARFHEAARPIPTVIMVSQHGHCLHDLLFRVRSGLLPIEVRAIVSNHRDFYQLAASYNIPFHHIPVKAETKPAAEAKLLELFEAEGGELLVLARYMQVLSDDLCRKLSGRAINIHHSFLPSFKGARPYQQAHERGVKLIGATAHYVTGDLDEGPIIEQDVARANHGMDVATLTTLGRDVESAVLARAVKWHAEHRILLDGHKTVVFR